MATTKKTTVKNETKVVCPVCGSEFDVLDPHEHHVKDATVLGVDSGIGIIELPVKKRGNALAAAGVDTSKYFSIQIPGGGEQWMQKLDDNSAIPVRSDDPIVQMIMGGGTVPNRKLFRRWVMSQVFHGLTCKGYRSKGGFSEWLRRHGYEYQWKMLVKELSDQAKLYKNGDMENFNARNRWFNKALAVTMAKNYIIQLREDARNRPQHKCKGVPYVTVDHKDYFVADIEKKLVMPLCQMISSIEISKSPEDLEYAVRRFWKNVPVQNGYKQSAEWKDAYRGMGAYATMQNLLRFHGCTFPKNNDFYQRRKFNWTDIDLLELAAKTYADGGGWRLFGLMKQMIEENGIDIKAKMASWAAAKQRK